MEKQNSFSNLISLPPFLPPNSGMESSRISGLQTFHYGRTDGRTDAEGRGGESHTQKPICMAQKNTLALSLQRRREKTGWKYAREVSVLAKMCRTAAAVAVRK